MNRRIDPTLAEKVTVGRDHAQLTANKTLCVYKVPADKKFQLTRVTYVNDTGLALDNTNAFSGAVKKGATQMALAFNTDGNDVPAGAALVANTWVDGTLSTTPADLWADAGTSIDFALTLEGTQTLPTGRLVIEGYLY